MKHSESMAKLAPALVKAQADLKSITKDGTNPHFNSKYVTLDAIIDTVRPVLASHGLTLVQGGFPDMDVRPEIFGVETILLHDSGEWISTTVEVPLGKKDPQGAGAAITYGRRYGIASLLVLATDEDDDGNSASRPAKAATPSKRVQAPPQDAKPSARVTGAIDRLPKWKGYEFADVELVKAPRAELDRLYKWSDGREGYEPLHAAIEVELDRRNDLGEAHDGLKDEPNTLPF